MCGITGITWDDKKLIQTMTNLLEHRGPDQIGSFSDKHVSLGHRRLSILDLSAKGNQPLTNENDSIIIVFNGEIYNWKNLRARLEDSGHRFKSNSDTEVIVHGYEEYGERICNHLEGDFAFAIYDMNTKKIILSRDRVGIKPLYYTFIKGKLAFSSEIKSLLEIPDVPREVDRKVLNRYITLRYPYGKETMFSSIFRMLPGEFLVYDCVTKQVRIKRYWQAKWISKNKSEEQFVLELQNVVQQSIKRQLMSDVPVGAYLSGGIDSASIVSIMSRYKKDPIKTFSVGFGSEDTDELKFAQMISDKVGTDHTEIMLNSNYLDLLPDIIWHCDEPIADPAMIPVFILSRNAKKHVTVVLTGDGGDELFAGYEQQKFLKIANMAGYIPGMKKTIATGLSICPPRLLTGLFKYAKILGKQGTARAVRLMNSDSPVEQYLSITSIFSKEEKKMLNPKLQNTTEDDLSKYMNLGVIEGSLKFEFDVQLPENMLMKTDRMAMAHSIEARVPLLDEKVLNVAQYIPLNLKLHGLTSKYIFRKAMKPFVPKDILRRKKQRFYVPINDWISQRPDMVDRLFSQELLSHKFFNKNVINKIKNKYNTAPLFYARQMWTLLTFQLWYERFIHNV